MPTLAENKSANKLNMKPDFKLIKNFMIDSNVQAVFEHLEVLFNVNQENGVKNYESDYLLFRARYSDLSKKSHGGILSIQDEILTANQFRANLVEWLKRLEDYFRDTNNIEAMEPESPVLKNKSIKKLKNILGDDLDIESDVDTSISVINEISTGEHFLRPVALYFAGRIGAGKSTSCNRFLDINKVGYFDTTKQITHSGFTTGLSVFDLPGQNGEPFFENVSRVALGLPIIEQHGKFNFGRSNLENFKYSKWSPKGIIEEREFNLLDWSMFAEKENILPDIIIYVIGIGKGQLITNYDLEFICELLEALKNKDKDDKIIFLFNDLGETKEEIYKLFRTGIESCYSMVFRENTVQNPMIFSVNALSGEGFIDFIKYLCEILPSDTIGQIKELFHQDFKAEIKKHLAFKFNENNIKIASKLSKFYPFENNKTISTFESSIIAIVGLAKHFLVNYEDEKHKHFFDDIQSTFLEIAKEEINKIVIPKTIRIPIVEPKSESVEIVNPNIEDIITRKMLDDIFHKSNNLSELKDAADDLLEEFMMTTTTDVTYDALIKYEEKEIYESIIIQTPILGPKEIYYVDYKAKIEGKKKAIENHDPKHLSVWCNKIIPEPYKIIPNAVIGYRDEEIRVEYNKGGMPFISFILGCGIELNKFVNEQEKGQPNSLDIRKRLQESIDTVRSKLESNKIKLLYNIESNNQDSEEKIKNIVATI
jgi:hypothetical protein